MLKNTTSKNSEFEFIALMALLMANVALSIDSILPGLNKIGTSIETNSNTDLQLIITMIFLGLGIGQLLFGTLSDSLGRKPIVYYGFVLFIIASFICISAESLTTMLIGRTLQGIGLSAPRSISISIIRDKYSGDYMARIMSFVTVIFILIPMIAPLIGQQIMYHYNWEFIFYFQILFALIVVIWFWLRQEETLPKSKRLKLTTNQFIESSKEFFRFPTTIIYTFITGVMTGCFMVFLSSSKQIFQDQLGYFEAYVYIIAGISFFLGLATLFNGNIVIRLGMKKLAKTALIVFSSISLCYIITYCNKPNPNVYIIFAFMSFLFLCLGFIFGNIRALTMEPIGHIAGIGAALSGFLSTLIAVPISMWIGSFINNTAFPMFVGFFACSTTSLLVIYMFSKKTQVLK